MPPRVVVIGLDGLDPGIVEAMLDAGGLPHLARLRGRGGYARVATTTPAQTPVAWATFATGVNPGGHGIFDFLRRDPTTYLPDLAFNRYEQANVFLPPRAVNLRQGLPVWSVLGEAGVPATVLRCPCTYPPDDLKGRMLSGMGVPDIRGGNGTATLYTTAAGACVGESEQLIELRGEGAEFRTQIVGPRDSRNHGDVTAPIRIRTDAAGGRAVVESDGSPPALTVERGQWSDWLRIRFRRGLLQSTAGMLRFYLLRSEPEFELYASPVNFDPSAPPFPISHPWDYGAELARRVGLFHTTGMVEDHAGLSNGRLDEDAFLAQCDDVLREREAMLHYELDRFDAGLLFCLFDTPDRVQHMFWRFGEPTHPANRVYGLSASHATVIADHYRRCDEIVGRVLDRVDGSTLVIVLSDHGFGSFQRGVHLNAWLRAHGLLHLRDGVAPGEEAGEFLRHVDWSRTRAYALGLGGIYLNLRGREGEGIVDPSEGDGVARAVVDGLSGLVDEARGTVAVRGVRTRSQVYRGACAADAPDLLVDLAPGYRVSWTTALGGVPRERFEDNARKWSGDHVVDPALVPGILFMSGPFRTRDARLEDMAPTILDALGVPVPGAYEGASLLESA